jgi:UDP-arabinose 4-epimerase
MRETVLVTGGAGYIGSHCCKLLASAGYRPVVYDDLSTGHRDFVKWGPLVEGDIRDRGKLVDALAAQRPALVMHFAALALVGESVARPERYWDVNVGGVFALLEAMRATGCDKLVFSSSCAVYGEPEAMPIDEQTTKAPVNPYGASKLTAEWMMESFDRAHGCKSVRLRYFNACGADPEGEIGEDHSPETHLIPLTLDVALGRRESIAIFGSDYPTPDGTAVRDYIHVLDLAAAHLAAAEHLLGGGKTAAVNLGTGEGASVAEVVGAVERVTGRKIATTSGPRRAGDPPRLVANPALAESLLGWKARRSALETAIADAWAWHQTRFDAARPALASAI